MDYKTRLLVVALFAGCIAAPRKNDFSKFFDQIGNEPRIIGGTQAAEGRHPHMVALSSGLLIRMFGCGGSLISRRTVLTAGHCVDNVYNQGLSRSLRGVVGTTRWAFGGTEYSFERNITHPNYVDITLKNDIALLITTTEVALNNLVQVVPIAYDFVPAGIQTRVAGWGRFGETFTMSATLQELTTTTIGDECIGLIAQGSIDFNIPAPDVEPHIEICTYHSAGVGNCHGDSGSALTRVADGMQIGVVSWALPCALGAPDMYVRLSAFQPWLESNII